MDAPIVGRVAELVHRPAAELRVGLRAPIDHQSNRLYDVWVDGRHLIAKEFLKPDEFSTAPVREHRALELLSSLDVAPKPLGIAPESEPPVGPVVVYEYLEGAAWDRRRPGPGEMAKLAELWLLLHGLPTEGLWPSRGNAGSLAEMRRVFVGWLDSYRRWAEAEFPEGLGGLERCLGLVGRLAPVAEELDRLKQQAVPCFCRSDARFANVIARPDGRLAMIDWEDSGIFDPARDLADLAMHANQEDLLTPGDLRAFLGPYFAARMPLDPTLERRVQLYLATFPAFWLAVLLANGARRAANGRLPTWHINGLPPNQRLRRYLARAVAWPGEEFSAELAALEPVRFFPDQPV